MIMNNGPQTLEGNYNRVIPLGFPGGVSGKESTCNARDIEDVGSNPDQEDPLE